MALREFDDERGRHWKVWDVYPTLAERRHRNAGPPPGTRERRRRVEHRVALHRDLAMGWLVFEANDGERRRLRPIPQSLEHWELASLTELRAWCATAAPASPARRLIE